MNNFLNLAEADVQMTSDDTVAIASTLSAVDTLESSSHMESDLVDSSNLQSDDGPTLKRNCSELSLLSQSSQPALSKKHTQKVMNNYTITAQEAKSQLKHKQDMLFAQAVYLKAWAHSISKGSAKPPERKSIGGNLLIENHNISVVEKSKQLHAEMEGVTITSDGWEDISLNSITNFVATGPSGTSLPLTSFVARKKKKSGHYMTSKFKAVASEFFPDSKLQLVIAFVCDSASNMHSTFKLIMEAYPAVPRVVAFGCFTHKLNGSLKTFCVSPGSNEWSINPRGSFMS